MAVSDLLHSGGAKSGHCVQKNIRTSLIASCPVFPSE